MTVVIGEADKSLIGGVLGMAQTDVLKRSQKQWQQCRSYWSSWRQRLSR